VTARTEAHRNALLDGQLAARCPVLAPVDVEAVEPDNKGNEDLAASVKTVITIVPPTQQDPASGYGLTRGLTSELSGSVGGTVLGAHPAPWWQKPRKVTRWLC
jgi:hypothetical protein